MAFDKIPKIEFVPLAQVPAANSLVLDVTQPQPVDPKLAQSSMQSSNLPTEEPKSLATELIEDFEKNLLMYDFIIKILEDKIKDVVVTVDKEESPDVWAAMQRIFGETADPVLTGASYAKVLDAINDVQQVEYDELKAKNGANDEAEFINMYTEKMKNGFNVSAESSAPSETSSVSYLTSQTTNNDSTNKKMIRLDNVRAGSTDYLKAYGTAKAENGKNTHLEYIGGVKYLVWEN